MSRLPNVRYSLLVARVELRRTWRKLTDTTRGLLMLVAGGLILPLYGIGLGAGAYFFGRALTSESFSFARPVIGATFAGVTGLVFALALQRAIKRTGEPDAAGGLLTTAPYQDVLAGLLLAEYGRLAATFAFPVAGMVVGFALGAESLLAGVVLLVLFGALVTLGLTGGYALGLVAKFVAGRSAFVARHRAAIGITATVAIPLLYVSLNAVPAVQRAAFHVAASTPFAWYADVLFLAVPGVTARPLFAVGAVASLFVGVPVLAVAIGGLAERVWYMDRVEPDHEFDPGTTTPSDRLLVGHVPRQTLVVARKSWRRARRSPFTIQFAIYPFFLLIFHLQAALLEGAVPPSLPLLVALASATAGGAAFCLNPLGGEGDVLPMTLTATVSGRQFVAGLALAGAAPGAALVVVSTVSLGFLAGLAPTTIAAAVVTGLIAAVAAPAIASGVGVVFPRFERTEVRSHEVVVPSSWAFAGYSLLLVVALAPALVTQMPALRSVVAAALPFGIPVTVGLGVLLTTALLATFASLSGGYAARSVGTYRLD